VPLKIDDFMGCTRFAIASSRKTLFFLVKYGKTVIIFAIPTGIEGRTIIDGN